MPDELFLIDGNSLAYRAFFALPESIATSTGVPTNAIFGFASMLVKILTDYGPKATVVVWDAGDTGRKAVYAEYKAQRATRPDLLKEQWPHLEPLVDAFGYRNLRVPGLRGRRRDRLDRGKGAHRRPEDPGDGGDRRPRRLPAGRRRRREDHDHLARDHRHAGLRPPGRDRPLRDPARADPRLHRAEGRHERQHPRRPRHRRQDRGRAAAAVRNAGRRPRPHRRHLRGQAQAEPDRARRGGAHLQAARHRQARHRRRARPPDVRRRRAGPLQAPRHVPQVRAARAAAPAGGGARLGRRRRPRPRGRARRSPRACAQASRSRTWGDCPTGRWRSRSGPPRRRPTSCSRPISAGASACTRTAPAEVLAGEAARAPRRSCGRSAAGR